ncbi:MAG: exodeoxyribonuclease III, partial [Candidatus Krumholzibacteria bacterium]|nr:exodeoxyribonuclease III [Candidatus Krumholzibacteria bacterium]
MRIESWNVNGIRAVERKEEIQWFRKPGGPDILCLQETKAHPDQLEEELRAPEGWTSHFASAEKKGYSGVVTFVRDGLPLKGVEAGLGIERFDREGRVICTDFGDFLLYNIYFPNGKASEERLSFKMDFYEEFQKLVNRKVKEGRKVLVCGDVNTAHRPIDLSRPKENGGTSGFLPEERAWIDRFLESGWRDSFREIRGEETGQYSWWSLRSGARA